MPHSPQDGLRWDNASTLPSKELDSRVAVVYYPIINSRWKAAHRAKNSFDGFRRYPAAGLSVCRSAFAAVAIPFATAAFQCAPPARSEFCVIDSWLRHRTSRDVASSDRNRDLGARQGNWPIELDAPSDLGRCDRNVPFNGLLLLVVALGHAHGPVLLAIS